MKKMGPQSMKGGGKSDAYSLDAKNRLYTTPKSSANTSAGRLPASRTGGSYGKRGK